MGVIVKMALTFLDSIGDTVLANVIGGSVGQAVSIGALIIIILLVFVLLVSRLDLEVALIIVSPAIIVGSFVGWLPPLSFGVIVLVIGLAFAGVILALAR